MTANYDERDEDRDWHEEHPTAQPRSDSSPVPDPPEPEDDAAHLPIRPASRRRLQPRRRGGYRPPSELDRE